jgi:dihydropteroate synthase
MGGIASTKASNDDTRSGRVRFAGLTLDRPLVMGIVNVTPDSFYDGGYHQEIAAAIAHGRRLMEEGADILDIGGESTRPGAAPVKPDVEAARVVPVVQALAAAGAVVSIDTRRALVMREAVDAGATIINDVTALTGDTGSLAAVTETGASAILMHMQGEPQTMQVNPSYDDVVSEVATYLAGRVAVCRSAGIEPGRLAVDPGIGFGKTPGHNLDLLASIDRLARLGVAVVVGASRKGFIGTLSRGERAPDRLPGSIAAALAAVARGAHIIRVHDVAATLQALAIWRAVEERD